MWKQWIVLAGMGIAHSVDAQTISWSVADTIDTTVAAGTDVMVKPYLQMNDSAVYSCLVRVENVNLPSTWYYTLCDPFICLAPNHPQTTFLYPDTVDYDFYNNGFGLEYLKIGIQTAQSAVGETGELDLVFENLTSGYQLSSHIIVRTHPQTTAGWNESMPLNPLVVFPNPVVNQLNFQGHITGKYYEISDQAGRIVLNGSLDEQIDCSNLQKGNYIVRLLDDSGENHCFFTKE